MYCTNDNFIKNKWLYFCIGGKQIAVKLNPLYSCPECMLSGCKHTKTGAVPALKQEMESYNQAGVNPLKILLN